MSEETEVRVGTLTSDDLKALRQCDWVSFHRNGELHSRIRATKQMKKADPFEDRERTHEIRLEDRTPIIYSSSGCSGNREQHAKCFAMVYTYYGTDSIWGTIASFLKVGDVLHLDWVGANNNQYLKNIEGEKLYHDYLYLLVTRGDKRFKFFVDDSVCADNTARMVKC